jgi:sensor domain CHASE-containing protein
MTHLAPPSGDLRTRTWASVGGPILGLVAAMACVAFILLWRFADHQDQAYIDTTTRLLENAVAAHEQTAANVATDYAMWNDAYEHITTRWDPEWIDRNYYSSIADGVMIVRADGAVRRTWIEQTQAVNRVALQAGVVRAVRTRLNLGALLSSAPGAATTASSVFVVDGQPVLLSV